MWTAQNVIQDLILEGFLFLFFFRFRTPELHSEVCYSVHLVFSNNNIEWQKINYIDTYVSREKKVVISWLN